MSFLYKRQDFPFKNGSLHDSIVWMISLTIFWRMTDGVFASREHAVDKQLVV